MLATSRSPILPPIPPMLRFVFLGIFAAGLFYVTMLWEPAPVPVADPFPAVEPIVAVPVLDQTILAQARDASREQRLLLEAEPLRHLLAVAINVGPTVANALGMPAEPVPVAELREAPAAWRSRWLWYKGVLEELSGPREGHPVQGYSIYEATIRLPDGNLAMSTFSLPPGDDVRRGGWVRIEGYLMKLRDTTYPRDIASAPMLVGRQIQRDYEDWGPVTQLDGTLLGSVEDNSTWPGTKAWHTLDEDQGEALWHLAAFVRDTAGQRTLADWRKVGTLNEPEVYPKLRENQLERGTPMRLLGTLIRRTTTAAPANPAGIKHWTVAYVQVRDFGGHLIPVWVPKRCDQLALRSGLEVRGFYYRWFAYEGQKGDRFRVPLFVAADLDEFHLAADKTMRELGVALAILGIMLMGLFWWAQRRASRQTLAHGRNMDARRRRRRERALANSPSVASPPQS